MFWGLMLNFHKIFYFFICSTELDLYSIMVILGDYEKDSKRKLESQIKEYLASNMLNLNIFYLDSKYV